MVNQFLFHNNNSRLTVVHLIGRHSNKSLPRMIVEFCKTKYILLVYAIFLSEINREKRELDNLVDKKLFNVIHAHAHAHDLHKFTKVRSAAHFVYDESVNICLTVRRTCILYTVALLTLKHSYFMLTHTHAHTGSLVNRCIKLFEIIFTLSHHHFANCTLSALGSIPICGCPITCYVSFRQSSII